MNKKMKKLGLLVVSALAMTMGVSSASALKIGANNVTSAGTYDDVAPNQDAITATVTKDGNHYDVTLNGAFKGAINVVAGEDVVLNLNGYAVSFNIVNAGSLTINGKNSVYTGTISGSGSLVINYGDFSGAKYTGTAGATINGIGTKFSSTLASKSVVGEGYSYEIVNGYYVVTEAPANLGALSAALTSTATHGSGYYLANEADYTKSSFAKYKEAYEKAQALMTEHSNNPIPISRQGEIETATAAYIAAAKGLKILASNSYSALKTALDNVNTRLANAEKKGIVYTDAILEELNTAIAKATADMDLPADWGKSNDSLDKMIAEINRIYGLLPKNEKADYSKVNALEALVASIGKDKFTAESWAVYAFAQDFDRDLPYTQQTDVDKYYAKLLAAFKGLDFANNQAGSTNPGSDEPTPSNPGNTGSNEPSNQGTTTNPSDTGNTNPNTPSNPSNQGNNNGGNNNSSSTVNPNTDETGTTSDVNTRDNVVVYAVMNVASLIALAGCGLVLRKQN